MSYLIIVAIIAIITIILCFYWFYTSDFLKRRIANHHVNSGESGSESMRIKNAIRELYKIKDKTPDDHMEIGELVAHNLLDDNRQNDGLRNTVREHFNTYLQTDDAPQRHNMDIIRNFATMTEDEQLQHAIIQSHNGLLKKEGRNNFEKLIERHNDDQNVHDSAVQKSMKKVSTSMNLYGDDKRDMDEIMKLVRGNERARKTVEAIKRYNNKMSNHNGKTEVQLLLDVYRRSKDPKNDEVLSPDDILTYGDNIRDNLVLQLADASALNGSVTCATGRVNRILQSLTLNDYEQRDVDKIGGTLEDYKNDIFKECNEALNMAADGKVAKYHDIALPKSCDAIREVYAGKSASAPQEEEFNKGMQDVFDKIIEKYGDKISATDKEAIKKDAYSVL